MSIMFPLPPHIYFEIGALITSIVFWQKIKSSPFKWFLPFLLMIVVVELIGRYIKTELHLQNSWLYNISIPIEYIFFALLFYSFYTQATFQLLAKSFLVAFTLFVIINILFIQGIVKFNTNTLKIGSLFMIVFSCLYFIDLLKQERTINLFQEGMFWVATGVLLFNTGEFLFNLFLEYLMKNFPRDTVKLFASINNKLIWIFYTCIAISIICIKQRKYQKA